MLMRDPVIYRFGTRTIIAPETRCIYPMYDYAHPLSDAIESITHSICTLEFENNREFYDWLVAEGAIFCRLCHTSMSLRATFACVHDDVEAESAQARRRKGRFGLG